MKNKLPYFLIILLVSLTLRLYWAKELFLYSHDQDLLGWVIRDILSGHIRLIGQETSQQGVFIGSAFYYYVTPFYMIFGMDPIGGIYAVLLISALTISTIYFTFSKMFNQKSALIASLLYGTSYSQILTDREVVPTTPVMLWSYFFLYAIYLISKSKFRSGFLLAAILIGAIWHINIGLILVLPLIFVAIYFSDYRKITVKTIKLPIMLLVIGLLPFIIFELRHSLQQILAIINSTASNMDVTLSMKLDRTFQLVSKNARRFLWAEILDLTKYWDFYVYAIALGVLYLTKKISKFIAITSIYWLGIFIVFFTFNPINLSEYYLNSANVVYLIIASVALSSIYELSSKKLATAFVLTIALFNINTFSNHDINQSGYIQRRQIVSEIKSDSKKHNYPCVSVSYITKPGFDLGYRYLFYLEDMHVNKPSSNSPVYSIVFPINMVDKVDMTFGAIGLIYPDYEKYNTDSAIKSCSGQNSNLTEPLFGYTE